MSLLRVCVCVYVPLDNDVPMSLLRVCVCVYVPVECAPYTHTQGGDVAILLWLRSVNFMDRGVSIKKFSAFPHEIEFLYAVRTILLAVFSCWNFRSHHLSRHMSPNTSRYVLMRSGSCMRCYT